MKQPVVVLGVIGVLGAIAIILLNGGDKTPEYMSTEALRETVYEAPTPIARVQAPVQIREPVQVQEVPVQRAPEVEVPVERVVQPQESEQDIMMSLPRQRLPNGRCPGERFRRTVPGGGPLGGMPLSDCESYPGQPIPQGSPPQGEDGASKVKTKGYDCDIQASKCRKVCIMVDDSTRQQLCRTDCEIDRSRCIQNI